MTPDSHRRWFGAVMWGAIGITFMILAVVAVYSLDSRIAGYAVGALVLFCLAVCGAAFWLDSRTAATTRQFIDQLRCGRVAERRRPDLVSSPHPAQPDRDLRPY